MRTIRLSLLVIPNLPAVSRRFFPIGGDSVLPCHSGGRSSCGAGPDVGELSSLRVACSLLPRGADSIEPGGGL